MGLQEVLWTIQSLPQDWQNLLDIALVGTVFFLILQFVRGTRAATLLRGIAIVLIFMWTLSIILNLEAFSWLLSRLFSAMVIAVPVIFQEELRNWLDRIGRFGLLNTINAIGEEQRIDLINELTDAVRLLSRRHHGALIVLERTTGLQEYMNTGVTMDSVVSSQLLQTVFFPKTALHDGAVIIRGDQIAAAACTLPVSSSRNLPDPTMGLRHRASLGLSEVSDAVVIIVSEESGQISVVANTRFIRGIDADRLALILREFIKAPERPRIIKWVQNMRGKRQSRSKTQKAA